MTVCEGRSAADWRSAHRDKKHGSHGDEALALDPDLYPELFTSLISKRMAAFAVDWLILAFVSTGLFMVLAVLAVLTLGLIWPLVGVVIPAVWLAYFTLTVGGPTSATPGMRWIGIEVRTWDGTRPGYVQAALQSLVFYATWTVTVFLLLVPLFNRRRRCLHDYLIGTVVINSPGRIRPTETVIYA